MLSTRAPHAFAASEGRNPLNTDLEDEENFAPSYIAVFQILSALNLSEGASDAGESETLRKKVASDHPISLISDRGVNGVPERFDRGSDEAVDRH